MRPRAIRLVAAWLLSLPAVAAGQENNAAITKTAQALPSGGIATGTAAQPPLVVKVSTDKPLQLSSGGGGDPMWLKVLVGTLPSLVALLVVWFGNRQSGKNSAAAISTAADNTRAAINQKANELQIERIDRWLAEFFGPFMQLSEENKRIADILRSRQPDPSFRTLHALLDPEWRKSASQTDLNLIDRIVKTGAALRTLIRERAGPTHAALSPYLSRAAAHFTILELANAGALSDRTEDFSQYVYPRQLDAVLDRERDRLEARRDELLADLSKRHPPAPALVIPAELALDSPKRPD